MLTNLLLLLLAVGAASLTLQLGCRFRQGEDPPMHQNLAMETYPVKSMYAIFTLAFTIEGFAYDLAIDTGSSDLFIKGENMAGNPVKKLSCPACLKNNRKASIRYLDGEVQTYLMLANVGLGRHLFKEFILVAY